MTRFCTNSDSALPCRRNEGANGGHARCATSCHERNRWHVNPADGQHRPPPPPSTTSENPSQPRHVARRLRDRRQHRARNEVIGTPARSFSRCLVNRAADQEPAGRQRPDGGSTGNERSLQVNARGRQPPAPRRADRSREPGCACAADVGDDGAHEPAPAPRPRGRALAPGSGRPRRMRRRRPARGAHRPTPRAPSPSAAPRRRRSVTRHRIMAGRRSDGLDASCCRTKSAELNQRGADVHQAQAADRAAHVVAGQQRPRARATTRRSSCAPRRSTRGSTPAGDLFRAGGRRREGA